MNFKEMISALKDPEFQEFYDAFKEFQDMEHKPPEETPPEPVKEVEPVKDPEPVKDDRDDKIAELEKQIAQLTTDLQKATTKQKLSDRTEDDIKNDEHLIDALFDSNIWRK